MIKAKKAKRGRSTTGYLLVERLGVGLDESWSGSYKYKAQTPTSSEELAFVVRHMKLCT